MTYVKKDGVYGIYEKGTNIFTEDNQILSLKEEGIEKVDGRKVPAITKTLLKEILARKQERIARFEKKKELRQKANELRQQAIEMEKEILQLEKERTAFQTEINGLVKKYQEDKHMSNFEKEVTGTEILSMSFMDGTLDTARAKVIIGKSNRPCFYTYGYTFRNPTTNHVPLSKEEAYKKIDAECYLDITFKENEIFLNAFSSNDMW